ncbi:MAG: hypothetical protein ACNA8H_14215, partial [Anaerolineales bacterium]
ELVTGKDKQVSYQKSGSLIDLLSMRGELCGGDQGAQLLALPREKVMPLLSTDYRGASAPSPQRRKRFSWLRGLFCRWRQK